MQKPDVVKKKSVSVILLAGGKGKRMGVSFIPYDLCRLRVNVCTEVMPFHCIRKGETVQ